MAVYKKSNSGYLPFIQKEKVTSPFTDIQNRAKVGASLKTVFGNERIHVNSLNKLNNEFGPNGEAVYEPDSGDTRVRFVGSNWQSVFSSIGLSPRLESGTVFDDYIEITFYGTGLNLLSEAGAGGISSSYSLDGAGYVQFKGDSSNVLMSRNYKTNTVWKVVSGISLGWHTIRIKKDTSVGTFSIYGFDIVNESSQVTVKSGKAHGNGYEYSLESDQLTDYNLGFDNILDANIGNKGGRVVVYMDPTDGSIKKRFTKTDTTAQYLSSSDHTNESIARVINFREFGRNRADDFSTLSTSQSDRAFTLDDGTTTLVSNNTDVPSGFEVLRVPAVGSYYTFTFVGTGLAFGNPNVSATPVNVSTSVEVDGVNVGDLNGSPRDGSVVNICSGLPYGTHTVKITTLAGGQVWNVSDFIIYGPKKPTLPEGAIEIADYNVMAEYGIEGSVSSYDNSEGVIVKTGAREIVYSGTWSIGMDNPDITKSGYLIETSTSGSYLEYTFFGTAVEMFQHWISGHSYDLTVTINGSSDLSSYTTEFVGPNTGGITFTAATGNVVGSGSGQNNLISVRDMPLGLYTIRVTTNNSSSQMRNPSFSYVTPIHSYNTTFGSLSMKDCRNFDSTKDINKISKTKNSEVSFDSSVSEIDWSKNISQILIIATGFYDVFFEEVYDENKPYVSVTSGQPIGRLSGPPQSYKVRVGITNTSDVGQTTHTVSTKVSGKLQKDKLEENE